MKADAKPNLEDVAALLCKGPAPLEVVAHLRRWQLLIADTSPQDHSTHIDRLLHESALRLQDLLRRYTIPTYERVEGEYPECIDKVLDGLDELEPLLAEGVERPRRGPKLDVSRHLCAAVCMEIWSERWGPQPHSPKLWEACEAYWVACDYPRNPNEHIRRWEDFLVENLPDPD